MKYQVYFTNTLFALEQPEFLFEADAIVDVLPRLTITLQQYGYKKEPYWRWMFDEKGAWIDFGYWSIFLHITNATMEDCLMA